MFLGSIRRRICDSHGLGFFRPKGARRFELYLMEPVLLIETKSLGRGCLHGVSFRTIDHFELMLDQCACLGWDTVRLGPRRAHGLVCFSLLIIIVIAVYSVDHVGDQEMLLHTLHRSYRTL
jgi:hypothetical protein